MGKQSYSTSKDPHVLGISTDIKSGVFETQESKTTYKYKKYNKIIGMTIPNLALMFYVEKLEFPY